MCQEKPKRQKKIKMGRNIFINVENKCKEDSNFKYIKKKF